ncbi:MAG: glutaminase [Muribaculaceae bacterium]|nr:glutaminase [Muribaculaceae bacterium]
MERIIALSDLRAAIDEAYDQFKNLTDGNVDPRIKDTAGDAFGISVMTPSGVLVTKGDSDIASPLGKITKIPTVVTLLSQNSLDELMQKSGMQCCCLCHNVKKPDIPISTHGVRAISAVEPANDSDGKYNILINTMISLMGSAPVLDDTLYRKLSETNKTDDIENKLAEAGYYLYDDATIAVDLLTRITSLKATTGQLATMAATIAADGFNPISRQNVFDGKAARNVVAMMAVHGMRKMTRPWMIKTGLPVQSSFGGAMIGVLPGTFGIAAYSPRLNEAGVPIKAAKAIAYIMKRLDASVYSSARLKIDETN